MAVADTSFASAKTRT